MTRIKRPTVHVIAEPNGAGKTTFASKYLPDFVRCREFLNADLIAAGLSPYAPETQSIRAGRQMLERMRELIAAHKTFCFETTFSGRTYVKILGDMRALGYRTKVSFLWLPNVALAIERVAIRVKEGGHGIPEPNIRRRYGLGLRNFFELYLPMFDEWRVYDSSSLPPRVIASGRLGKKKIASRTKWEMIDKFVRGHGR